MKWVTSGRRKSIDGRLARAAILQARRAKKAPSPPLLSVIAEHLDEQVEITRGGKRQTVSLSNAFAAKLLHEAMTAPLKDKLTLFRELRNLRLPELQTQRYEEENEKEDL